LLPVVIETPQGLFGSLTTTVSRQAYGTVWLLRVGMEGAHCSTLMLLLLLPLDNSYPRHFQSQN
jgi:hypothetical protein